MSQTLVEDAEVMASLDKSRRRSEVNTNNQKFKVNSLISVLCQGTEVDGGFEEETEIWDGYSQRLWSSGCQSVTLALKYF